MTIHFTCIEFIPIRYLPLFESASLVCKSVVSNLCFTATRLVTGVDLTSSVLLFLTPLAFLDDNNSCFAGDFYEKNIKQLN